MGHSGRHPVTRAVTGVAEERPSPHHTFGLQWIHGITPGLRPRWIQGRSLSITPGIMVGIKPIRTHLPHVARHVKKAVPVGWVLSHRGRSIVAIAQGILHRKPPRPDVAPGRPLTQRLPTPRVGLSFRSAPGRPLPFRLCRKPLATPLRIGNSVCVAHMDHWVVFHSTKSTLRAERMAPIRPVHPTPPLGSILQSDRMIGRRKHQGTRCEIGIRGPGRPRRKLRLQLRPIQRSFRHRDITRGLHKSSELTVGHFMGIHQKGRQRHRMGRKFPRQGQAILPCSHPKRPAGNGHHVAFPCRGMARSIRGFLLGHSTPIQDHNQCQRGHPPSCSELPHQWNELNSARGFPFHVMPSCQRGARTSER